MEISSGMAQLMLQLKNQIKDHVSDAIGMVFRDGTVDRSFVMYTLCVLAVCSLFLPNIFRQEDLSSSDHQKEETCGAEVKKRDFTIAQLREFDGAVEEKPIYVSLKGDVYDVSSARHLYGPESAYHCMAGREASRAMAKLSFDERDLQCTQIDDLNAFERSTLDDWIDKFQHYKGYPVVGRCCTTGSTSTDLPTMTKSQLLSFRGKQDVKKGRISASIYVGVKGKVFDVSFGGEELYGEGGPYHIFAGIDASRALAKMSFEKDDLESDDLSDLSDTQVKTLEEWVSRFTDLRKYPVVAML